MADVTQIPGSLNIKMAQGDDLSILVDFDIDLTGYTFESKVVETDGTEVVITVTETDLSAGQVTLEMTDTLSTALTLTDTGTFHSWYLDRTDAGSRRRYLAGNFEVIKYK